MRYCGPRGIPHSWFLGGEHRWTPADRDKALWWLIHHGDTCPSCHTRPEEWDPERGGSHMAYVPETRGCPGCERLAPAAAAITDEGRARGVRPVLVPFDPARHVVND